MNLRLGRKNLFPIGLDLGSHSMKMLQVGLEQDKWCITAAASCELPQDTGSAVGTEPGRHIETLAPLVRKMLNEAPFVGRRVVSLLPESLIQYKNLRLPQMPRDELRRAVGFEAADRLRLDAEQFQIQFIDAGEVRQGEELRQEVIVLACPTDVVNAHVDLLVHCNLVPAAIDAEPSALARFVDQADLQDPNDPAYVMLDVGYLSSKVVICRNGRVLFCKRIDIGGHTFDQAVAEQLNIPINDASTVRRDLASTPAPEAPGEHGELEAQGELGANGPDGELVGATRRQNVDRSVFDAVRHSVGELARELGLCLRYYSITFRGKRPGRISVIGGEANHRHMVEMLAQTANIEVQVIQTPQAMDLTNICDNGLYDQSLCKWAVALGLSMRTETAKAPGGKRRVA